MNELARGGSQLDHSPAWQASGCPTPVLVFKTSVGSTHEVEQLRPWIDHVLPEGRWNFDLEDCDHILRVETSTQVRERLTVLLNGMGFVCIELE